MNPTWPEDDENEQLILPYFKTEAIIKRHNDIYRKLFLKKSE